MAGNKEQLIVLFLPAVMDRRCGTETPLLTSHIPPPAWWLVCFPPFPLVILHDARRSHIGF